MARNQASKANLIQLPAMLAGAVVGNGSMLGQLAQLGIGLGCEFRAAEVLARCGEAGGNSRRADDGEGGIQPDRDGAFLREARAQGGSRAPEFLSDHPNPGDRTKYVQEEVREMAQRDYTSTGSGQLKQIQSRIGSLPAAPAPNRARSTGVVGEGNPMPSRRLQRIS